MIIEVIRNSVQATIGAIQLRIELRERGVFSDYFGKMSSVGKICTALSTIKPMAINK